MALPAPSAGSTCLITGASAGIGVELARALARRGHSVTLVARRLDRLEQLGAELSQQHNVRVESIACDVSQQSQRDSLVRELEQRELTVEVLCNNAGFGSGRPFVQLERERELELLRVNCEAVVDFCARYVPAMVERRRGAVLNVASTASFQPLPGQSTYAASKALVLSFTEALHQELRRTGVSVTALCPGPVRTEFVSVAGLEAVDAGTPAFLWATAEEVAEAAVRGLEKGTRVVIPGLLNELGAIVGRHSPRGLFLRAAGRFYPVGRD